MKSKLHYFLCSVIILTPITVQAGHVTYNGTVAQKASFDSNPQMLSQDVKELYGSSTTASIIVKNKTPLWLLDFGGSTTQNLFNQSTYNSTDFNGSLALKRESQNWNATLKSSTTYNTTRSSEITTFGQNIGAVKRFQYQVTPELSLFLTQKLRLKLEGTYLRTTYNSNALVNYTTATASPALVYQHTKDFTSKLAVKYRQHHTDNETNTRIDSIAPSLRFLFTISPKLSGIVLVGINASKERNNNQPTTKWGLNKIYEAALAYKSEQNNIQFIIIRKQQPYANGDDELLTSFKLNGAHNINKSLSLNATATYQTSASSSSSTLKNKINTNIGLKYKLTSDIDLNTSYEYRAEKYNNSIAYTNGNIAMINLVWHPFNQLSDN